MNDPGLNELLKWSVQNSDTSRNDPNSRSTRRDPTQGLSGDALAALLGGPTDADRMRDSMAAIRSPDVDLENKLIAFDNFEQLVEQIDNANNMEALGLWMPLVDQLGNDEPQLREMAAWCIGTAAQNNAQAQQRVLILGAIPTLVKLATQDPTQAVRKKAILALSSVVRNFQPGMDAALPDLPAEFKPSGDVDANDMDQVDPIIQALRDKSQERG